MQGIDTFFGLDYTLNLYRGCQHRCIYCDSRSLCYGIEAFDREVLIKANAVEVLRDELRRKRRKGIIGTGSMNDPYMPLEKNTELTRRALKVIAAYGFGVHILTKSDLVARDIDILRKISRVSAAVSFTITTVDDSLSKVLEPGAPISSARFDAMRRLSAAGIETRLALMPVLPYLEDSWENVSALLQRASQCGASVAIAWFGMTMRDRQRDHFYQCLERSFPGLRQAYEAAFGDQYICLSPNARSLQQLAKPLCRDLELKMQVNPLLAPSAERLRLFE